MNKTESFYKHAEKLIKLMLKEHQYGFYDNYHKEQRQLLEDMIDQFIVFKSSKEKYFEPPIYTYKKLEKLCDRIIQKAKLLGMYHEIGFQIAEFYDERLRNEEKSYLPLITTFKKGKVSNKEDSEMLFRQMQDERYRLGVSKYNVIKDVDEFIIQIRKIVDDFS